MIEITSTEKAVLELKAQHNETWRNKSDWFWLCGLLEEVYELAMSLIGLHHHPPEVELMQIAAIAMNWLEKNDST